MLRAAACGSFSLLFEGLGHADAAKEAVELLDSVKKELREEGLDYCADIPHGINVETLLLLRELGACPGVDFLCLDFDRLLSSVLPTYASQTPSQKLKEHFFALLREDLKQISAPICARTVHSPHMWKKADAHACRMQAFFVPSEQISLWKEWNAEK